MKYRTIQEDNPLLEVLLTRLKAINNCLQRVLCELKKTKEEKREVGELNYKKKLKVNKQDYEKWKHIAFT